MCIFNWDRWSCGHFKTTRIDYCSYARDLAPEPRNNNILCHKPSDSPELNNHIDEPCGRCFQLRGGRWSEVKLPYAQIRVDKRSRAPDPSQLDGAPETHDLITSYELVNDTRRGLSQLCTVYRDNAWKAVTTLTHELLKAEDEYRRIGSRYYYRDLAEPVIPPRRRSYTSPFMLEDALHGNSPQRTFLQPFKELEASLHKALQLLNAGQARDAYLTCFQAFPHAHSILKALEKLTECVEIMGSYSNYVFLFRSDGQHRDDDRTEDRIRDEAM